MVLLQNGLKHNENYPFPYSNKMYGNSNMHYAILFYATNNTCNSEFYFNQGNVFDYDIFYST